MRDLAIVFARKCAWRGIYVHVLDHTQPAFRRPLGRQICRATFDPNTGSHLGPTVCLGFGHRSCRFRVPYIKWAHVVRFPILRLAYSFQERQLRRIDGRHKAHR